MSPLAIIGAVAAGAYLLKSMKDQGDGFIPVGNGAHVYDRENARGVHPDLQWLLDEWEREGWFDVRIPSTGGVRTQAMQSAAYAAKLSKLADVSQSPHGKAGALDVHPIGFNENACFKSQPGMLDKMNAFGAWAKSKGFTWGGDWSGFYSPACQYIDNVRGDRPHVEITAWRSLPYPPPNYWSPY